MPACYWAVSDPLSHHGASTARPQRIGAEESTAAALTDGDWHVSCALCQGYTCTRREGGWTVRQQHDLDTPRHDDFSNAPPTPTQASAPHPAPSRTASIPSLAELAGLTHLLVAPITVERALTSAVERAAQLVPNARRVALYALNPATPSRLIQLATAERERGGELPRLNAEPVTAETLGFGEQADRQVLVEHSIVRPASATLLPLPGTRDAPLGALVVEMASASARPDIILLGLIGDTLGTLLEHRAAAEEQQRAARALAALPALAFAPADGASNARAPAGGPGAADALAQTEEVAALLQQGARELRALAAAHECIALVRMPNGAWTALPGVNLPGDIGITPAQAEALLLALREGPVTIAPDQNAMLWSELAPLRQQAGYPNARVHLIAAASPHETYAIYALAEGMATPPGPRWLPLAHALATAVAAGIAARYLAAEARDEAHARDTYMSLAAHELRSPMTAIKGYAQLLLRQAHKQRLPEPMMRSTEAIEQQSQRLAEMLGELLDASRLRRGTLLMTAAQVDMGAALRTAVERRQAMYPQHTIALDLPPQPLTVAGESARIEQVLRDLIDNAARHSPSGGEIVIDVTTPRAGEAQVAVRDSGIGVAPEDRERIFEYLYRAPRSEERNLSGLGLGLYVSRHLVERMGGRLWLESTSTEPPSGSEFRFTLPLA